MEKRTIWVKPSCFTPEIEMIIPIPEDRDAEEYIDEFLDTILCEDLRQHRTENCVQKMSLRGKIKT